MLPSYNLRFFSNNANAVFLTYPTQVTQWGEHPNTLLSAAEAERPFANAVNYCNLKNNIPPDKEFEKANDNV